MTLRSSFVATCASCARQGQRVQQTPSAASWRRTATTTTTASLLSAQQSRRPVVQARRTPPTTTTTTTPTTPAWAALARPFSQTAAMGGKRKKNLKRKREEAEAARAALPPLPYYELFKNAIPDGPPPVGRFHINGKALHQEYLRLQAQAHPDFFHEENEGTGGSEGGENNARGHSAPRAQAEARSSLINEAYRTLQSPLLRAEYVLRERYGADPYSDETMMLQGDAETAAREEAEKKAHVRRQRRLNEDVSHLSAHDRALFERFGDDDADDDDDDDPRLNASYSPSHGPTSTAESNTMLLMAVLEAREAIAEARTESDLEPLQAMNHLRRNHSEDIVDAAFAQEDIPAVQEETMRLRYWASIDDALRNWQPPAGAEGDGQQGQQGGDGKQESW